MARTRGAWTIGEHLEQGYALTAYCNNPRCGRSKRRQGRYLDLRKLDPHLTLDELQPKLTKIEDVIAFARQHPDDGLIVFADGSDNPGGGAPADGTVALRALIDANFEGAVVGVLFDPETAAQAHAAGVGATIRSEEHV